MAPGTRFSFVHAADLHLDTPFSGVAATSRAVAETLRDASLAAFDAIVDLALQRDALFVLFAGDVYDGSERGVRAQLRFLDGLTRLADAGISSFVVYGNHDPLESGWSAITTSWPDRVTIFPAGDPTIVDVARDGVRLATVQGVSYERRATEENLALRLRRPAGPGVHVGLLHCNVEGSPKVHSNYSPCTLADLQATGLDYLALGHVHDRRILSGGEPSEPWVVYPGNTQARSIAETGARGVYVVEVEDERIAPPEFVACDGVRFCEPAIDIATCESLGDLAAALCEQAEADLRAATGRPVVARVRLVGRSSVHRELAKRGALEDLGETIRARTGARRPFWHLEALVDATLPELDLESVRARGDFAADLLALADELEADPDATGELFAELGELAPRRLRRELDALFAEPEARQALLSEARLRALDAMEDE